MLIFRADFPWEVNNSDSYFKAARSHLFYSTEAFVQSDVPVRRACGVAAGSGAASRVKGLTQGRHRDTMTGFKPTTFQTQSPA